MQLPKPNQIEFEIPNAGTFVARCYRFIDLGTQPKTFEGKTTLKHQVRLSWELPTELMTKGEYAGKPFSVHQTYTWSMGDKATLRKSLESWRGRKFTDADFGENGFNTKKLVGVPCMLGISHTEKKDKVFANISTISPPLKDYPMPEQINESLYFSFDDAMAFAMPERKMYLNNFLDKVSQGTKDAIMSCPEYKKAMGIHDADDNEDMAHAHIHVPEEAYSDAIPF